MAKSRNQASKGEVQTTELNKMPVPGEDNTGFTAKEAAEVFEKNQVSNAVKHQD